jgi:hypothetical protein
MNFGNELGRLITQAGWNTDRYEDNSARIIRQISSFNDRGLNSTLMVSLADVGSTWDKWPEDKQTRGLDTLKASLTSSLGRVRPGMSISLNPNDWTPPAT